MPFIEPEDRKQSILFNNLDDMISSNNPIRVIDKIVEKIVKDNTDEFIRVKDSRYGAPSYQAQTILKLYFYGYLNMIKSSRRLETETYRNIELMWLIGNLHPDHWTISQFRKEHGEMIKKLWNKFKEFLRNKEYIDLKIVAIDGTKVKANTSRDMITLEVTEKSMSATDKLIEEYLQQLVINDTIEDAIQDNGGTAEPTAINRSLIEKIAKLEEKIEELDRTKKEMESKGLKRISKTDKEAKLIKSREGKHPGYNVQVIVDAKNHMIADFEVTTDENDLNQLKPMIQSIIEEYGEKPEEIIADKGYFNIDAIEEVRNSGIEVYVSPQGKREENADIGFNYDKENNLYKCSEGKELRIKQKNKRKGKDLVDMYQGIDCNNCSKKENCTQSKTGRIVYRYPNQEFRDYYRQSMDSKIARAKLKLRRCLAEHPFGTIKYLMGKIPLLLRGVPKVSIEMTLYTMAYNFKRLIKVEKIDELTSQINAYNWA